MVPNYVNSIPLSKICVETLANRSLDEIPQAKIMIPRQFSNDFSTLLAVICVTPSIIPVRKEDIAKSIVLSQPVVISI